ncbi:lysophospholipid acyltransferase family protein [Mariprofundus sp. KV]|uniref:lysophospholipid acyltransferase family protein n=1 Tax=Mariprofundus sp. KV TaxID=2608715 RepID=UPI0015A32368|nr:lysophospholipid acyltransferase family protein [Mariprofundus sp. KV]NWF36300.1 lysophospholipid acyltransferase family protein [Mariprofundus sp. KV]
MRERLLIWLVPRLIRLIIAFLSLTIRWQRLGGCYDPAAPERHIFAFWHARILMMGVALRGCRGYTLISEHRDGGYIADTLQLQGFRTIRGSSTRGGARALLQMVRTYQKERCDFGITPDGPKGPRERVQLGTIQLAKKTGLPIRPVIWATKRQWRITSSWDHFYIPKPFTAGVIVYGEAVSVAADADDHEALLSVQQAMDATQQAADSFFKQTGSVEQVR